MYQIHHSLSRIYHLPKNLSLFFIITRSYQTRLIFFYGAQRRIRSNADEASRSHIRIIIRALRVTAGEENYFSHERYPHKEVTISDNITCNESLEIFNIAVT